MQADKYDLTITLRPHDRKDAEVVLNFQGIDRCDIMAPGYEHPWLVYFVRELEKKLDESCARA